MAENMFTVPDEWVKAVRCKDCKHWKHFDHLGCTDFVKVCGLANYMVGATGFCVYGEKRDEDGRGADHGKAVRACDGD